MSAYNGRRGPNVSAYLANLNTLSPEQRDVQEPQNLDPDFSLFLDTDYFDQYDNGNVDLSAALDLNVDAQAPAPSRANRTIAAASAGQPEMDFNINGKYIACFLPSCYLSTPFAHCLFSHVAGSWMDGHGQGCRPRQPRFVMAVYPTHPASSQPLTCAHLKQGAGVCSASSASCSTHHPPQSRNCPRRTHNRAGRRLHLAPDHTSCC